MPDRENQSRETGNHADVSQQALGDIDHLVEREADASIIGTGKRLLPFEFQMGGRGDGNHSPQHFTNFSGESREQNSRNQRETCKNAQAGGNERSRGKRSAASVKLQ